MAENQVRDDKVSAFDFDSEDTPVPAAEMLIDLKESARRRRNLLNQRPSPKKPRLSREEEGSPLKTPNHHSSSRRLDFSAKKLPPPPPLPPPAAVAGVSHQNSLSSSDEDCLVIEEEPAGAASADEPYLFEDEEDDRDVNFIPEEEYAHNSKRNRRTKKRRAIEDTAVTLANSMKQRPDQATLHSVSSRLRNLLKLPKAHNWCYYEWFYSNIDQPLMDGENDFCRCLADMFPSLKTHSLTFVQWRQLRRLIGKPRRCSQTFFREERQLMDSRRKQVREIQQQMNQGIVAGDFSQYKDIPDEIPSLLVVGTAVTARLHTDRERGFFTGRIEAVDIDNHRYLVSFDRPGIGKHAVMDTEVRSADKPEMVMISSLEASQKQHWPPSRDSGLTPPRHSLMPNTSSVHTLFSPDSRSDPFLTSSPARRKLLAEAPSSSSAQPSMPEQVGGFPVEFLKQVTQLSKLLQLKQHRIQKLNHMNTELEKLNAHQKPVQADFQKEYATVVVDLDDINKQLNKRLGSIRMHCETLGYVSEVGGAGGMDVQEHASKMTESANTSLEASGSEVKEPALLGLISSLTGLLLQVEALSESGNSMDVKSLSGAVEEIEQRIHSENRNVFQDHVETPIMLIQSGMNPVGTLHAFSAGSRHKPHHHHTLTPR